MARALVNLRQLNSDSPLLLCCLNSCDGTSESYFGLDCCVPDIFRESASANVDAITPEIVELPRLRVSFKLKRNRKTGVFELHSIDRHGLFVTGISRPPDLHDETKPHLLQGLPHGIILKSFSGTQYVMLPNYPMRRCKVKFCPFTVTTHPQPEDRLWQAAYVLFLSISLRLSPSLTNTNTTKHTPQQTTYRCGSARTCVLRDPFQR